MKQFLLLVCVAGIVLAGCSSPEPSGSPPPYPQPTFDYTLTEIGGAEVLNITLHHPHGLTNESLRILIDGKVAYEGGTFYEPYEESRTYENEWADGVEEGDTIMLTNGTTFSPGTEIDIQLRRLDTGEWDGAGHYEFPGITRTATE